MTDTDLITAGESTDGEAPSNSVTTDTSDVKTVASGSLATMVLPELRALANQAGVKGTSGMRKNELIAAIQEIRGQANGTSAGGSKTAPSTEDSGTSGPSGPEAKTEAPAPQEEQKDSSAEAQRREIELVVRMIGNGRPLLEEHESDQRDRHYRADNDKRDS